MGPGRGARLARRIGSLFPFLQLEPLHGAGTCTFLPSQIYHGSWQAGILKISVTAKVVLFVVRTNTGSGPNQGTGQATESASKVISKGLDGHAPACEVVSGFQSSRLELRLGRTGQEFSTAG
ncbi:hypothetical protein LA080_005657 [Diaporthe eres]|nr:hypothetical protein LA080_005657 [Diaporthe eres]